MIPIDLGDEEQCHWTKTEESEELAELRRRERERTKRLGL